MRHHSLLPILCLAVMLAAGPVAAQEGIQPQAGGTTVHVVQRDETLFGIAMRYGTTVEAISEANGIADARYIGVGQRLLIPNANVDTPGAVITYTIGPGDTLDTLARRFQTTPQALAEANAITNPGLVYVGQDLTISHGATGERPLPEVRQLYRAQPGDTLARIAVLGDVPLNALLSANGLELITPMFAGQKVWLPGNGAAESLVDLPAWLTALSFTPVPVIQGRTVSITAATVAPADVAGSFMGYPLQVVTDDRYLHRAFFGVHPFAEPGVYPLQLAATFDDGVTERVIVRLRVDGGGYGAESIDLIAGQEGLLTANVTEPEWERVARLMSAFSPQRYFDGLMGLPSTGGITSLFGTRRVYNGDVLSTFHSGTDFGGLPGSNVTAPAAGVVVLAESLPVRGNAVIIDHGWGIVTGYWHLAEIKLGIGAMVAPGTIIGTVGSTGRSTGPHLHWEMWVGGVQVDPMQWVQAAFP